VDDDEELEALEQENQPTGFESLPPETQREIKKLRKEAQALRTERGTLQREVLTAKYGEEVVGLIPVEVTAYERQVEEAEKLKAIFPATVTQEAQAPETPEPAPEVEVPAGLKAITGTPPATSGIAPGSDMSAKEIGELGKTDPVAAFQAMRGKYGNS
jgi:hypothetical protein